MSNSELFASAPDVSDGFFDAQRVINVDIEMDPQEYEVLRYEGRQLGELLAGCIPEFEYSHFKAKVSIDGRIIENVDVRKKGFLGSLSPSRPSFKLNFDEYKAGRTLESMSRMTLNNNRQDGSASHQCVSYDLFRKAGLKAPRCNFAKVSVNGNSLGYYSNVESINEQFLQRNYTNSGGNLYEAQLGGFAPKRKQAFQLKTNKLINDTSDIEGVINALAADDSNLPGLLEQVLDVDQFFNFWAMEIITGHWDGASGNTNNYFVYNNPADGRFTYIPWGTDGAISEPGLNNTGNPLFNFSFLANRLYKIPAYQQRLVDTVEQLMGSAYNEADIEAQIDSIHTRTSSSVAATDITKEFIQAHRANLNNAIANRTPEGSPSQTDSISSCDQTPSQFSGQFNGSSGSFTFTTSAGETLNLSGFVQRGSITGGGILGLTNPETESFNIIAFDEGVPVVAIFSIEQPEFKTGVAKLHGVATSIFVFHTGTNEFGIAANGAVTFDEVGAPSDPFSGQFEAELFINNGFLNGVGN